MEKLEERKIFEFFFSFLFQHAVFRLLLLALLSFRTPSTTFCYLLIINFIFSVDERREGLGKLKIIIEHEILLCNPHLDSLSVDSAPIISEKKYGILSD